MTDDTGYVFRARWPITDDGYTLSQLRVQAAALIDDLAARHGARIVGDITWTLTGEGTALLAEAPARPRPTGTGRARHGLVTNQADRIRTLATEHHYTDRRIAEVIGCTASAIAHVRRANRIPAGVGNPTLASAA